MKYLAPYGSRGHGTHVAGFSAVDGFAVMPKSRLFESSGKSLAHIGNVLVADFPNAFVTEGRPVLAIPFGSRRSQKHHIVPAFEVDQKDEHDLFAVPGPNDRWTVISPAAHSV